MEKNNLIQVLQDWELLLSEISRNGTALDNNALYVLNETIRAALAPVDVEGLKREVDEALSEFWGTDALYATNKASVHKAIDHLAARGFFGVWQPIETAPKDGTWIMVYWPTMGIGQYPFVVFWDEGWQPARYSDRDYGEAFPTHWMPLPAAPKKEGV